MKDKSTQVSTHVCPRGCDIHLDPEPYNGELLECPHCGYFPIVRLQPLKLADVLATFREMAA